jgi:Tol biopolymer transport system component
MRARLLLLVPLLSFAGVFAGTLAYYELGDDEVATITATADRLDAKGTLLVALEREPSVRLYSVALDGSGGRFLIDESDSTDDSVPVEAHPDWSPSAKRIAFTRYTVKGRNASVPKIWTVGPDGSDLVQLTSGQWPDFLPAWSPDGTKIAFTREVRGSAEIFVVNADGSGEKQLTHDPELNEEHPAWSPDGTHLAYTAGTKDESHLYVMSSDGSQATPLTSGPFWAADPAWAPAGDAIAFICDTDVCLIGAEQGSRATQLIGTRPKESSPRWSADGRQIAFARFPGGVFLYDLETKRTMRVPLEGDTFSLSWGPA